MTNARIDRVERIAALVAFERALLVVAADRIARVPALPMKMVLCRWINDAAGRIELLRRALPASIVGRATESAPDAAGRRVFAVLGATAGPSDFFRALCTVTAAVLRPRYGAVARATASDRADRGAATSALDAAVRSSARATHRLERFARRMCSRADHCPPTILRDDLAEAVLRPADAAGDVSSIVMPLDEPARERAIRALRAGEAEEDVWFVESAEDHARYLHQFVAFEINAFEAVSRHIAESVGLPWGFHRDMALQIGDELAHLTMWLERLRRIGVRLGTYPLGTHELAICAGHDLPGRVAVFQRLIEASALDALCLSRCMWECRDDAVMTAYIDRVERDEIRHVRYGNEWLRRMCGDDSVLAALVERAEAAARDRLIRRARELERAGIAAPGNAERVRRRFDDPLTFEVNAVARERAGFTRAEIGAEIERRRRARREGGEGRAVEAWA